MYLQNYFFDLFLYLLVIIPRNEILIFILVDSRKFTFSHQRLSAKKIKVKFLKNPFVIDKNRLQIQIQHAPKPLDSQFHGNQPVKIADINKKDADLMPISCIFTPRPQKRKNMVAFAL